MGRRDDSPQPARVKSCPATAQGDEPVNPKGGKKRAQAAARNDEAVAARLLADWIKKITDVELPIATEAKDGVPAVFIGKAAVQAGLKLDDIASASREGVRIVADDKRILIGGQSDAATHKAVCRFLEELGCRYFMDGPLGEVFPRTRTLAPRTS